MSEKVSRNAEGYPDPTFGGAWGNMRREEKQREAERMAKNKRSHTGNEADS